MLIAETGGQNAMIVDSSALPEQVVTDALASAFDSAGPALLGAARAVPAGRRRDHVLAMLKGAMRELVVGDPRRLATDVGPVIDAEARDALVAHVAQDARARLAACSSCRCRADARAERSSRRR